MPLQQSLKYIVHPNLSETRIMQSYLMIGPSHSFVLDFVNIFIKRVICSEKSACGHCKNCRMLAEQMHPDVQYILPESNNSPIKIELIRNLQFDIYNPPQCASYRFIIINPADKLNLQAANALLKILEEPPKHTIFILIAEKTISLPATIMSRCQKYLVITKEMCVSNNIAIANLYDAKDERAIIYNNLGSILALLQDLVTKKITVCSAVSKLKDYQLENVVWFLYLITSEVIKYVLIDYNPSKEDDILLYNFAKTQNAGTLYKQIDLLNGIIHKNQQNIALNATLVLESILLGYTLC